MTEVSSSVNRGQFLHNTAKGGLVLATSGGVLAAVEAQRLRRPSGDIKILKAAYTAESLAVVIYSAILKDFSKFEQPELKNKDYFVAALKNEKDHKAFLGEALGSQEAHRAEVQDPRLRHPYRPVTAEHRRRAGDSVRGGVPRCGARVQLEGSEAGGGEGRRQRGDSLQLLRCGGRSLAPRTTSVAMAYWSRSPRRRPCAPPSVGSSPSWAELVRVEISRMPALRYRLLDAALAAGLLRDPLLRGGSRYGSWARERHEARGGISAQDARRRALLQRMRSGPIAERPEVANQQHYELPSEFFESFLGPRRKYSGCLWPAGTSTLAAAEEAMLSLSCQRAQVRDGMRILDLGCGWGSLSLWLAERYPAAQIEAVSNSHGQRQVIETERDRCGLDNLRVVTADINDFEPGERFDRVMSIEMFEHMRNWRELLRRISGWLEDDGRLFVHTFSHQRLPYLFQGTWAAERFFTAGLMPSHDLIAQFQEDLVLKDSWAIPGTHYARTLQAWLERLDANRDRALAAIGSAGVNGGEARVTLARWRLFLLSTQEMWSYRDGDRWLVSHHLLGPRRASAVAALSSEVALGATG